MKFKDKTAVPVAAQKLRALLGVVPTLRSMEVGLDILGSERSYDLILIAEFDDMAAMHAYDAHEAHQAVREYIKSVRESSVSVDYEV